MSKPREIPTVPPRDRERLNEGVGQPVKSRVNKTNWMVVEPPYIILLDKNGVRRIWTNSKKKIILYYLWRITRIEWFIKKYNKLPR